MPGFVQIMEFKTSRIDEVDALLEKYRAERGGAVLVRRAISGADRERPGYYVNVIEFDSYEEAMKNSNDPATSAFAEQMKGLLDSGPNFYNLDVRSVIED